MPDAADTKQIDWTQPLEAVWNGGSAYPAVVHPHANAYSFNHDVRWDTEKKTCVGRFYNSGQPYPGMSGWRIRNRRPEPLPADTVTVGREMHERMVALMRKMGAPQAGEGKQKYVAIDGTAMVAEARAIVAMLPDPIDPDLIEARECVAGVYDAAGRGDLAVQTRQGGQDNRLRVQSALAAIRRGRALAAAEVEK